MFVDDFKGCCCPNLRRAARCSRRCARGAGGVGDDAGCSVGSGEDLPNEDSDPGCARAVVFDSGSRSLGESAVGDVGGVEQGIHAVRVGRRALLGRRMVAVYRGFE